MTKLSIRHERNAPTIRLDGGGALVRTVAQADLDHAGARGVSDGEQPSDRDTPAGEWDFEWGEVGGAAGGGGSAGEQGEARVIPDS